jgi:hypothetical protein
MGRNGDPGANHECCKREVENVEDPGGPIVVEQCLYPTLNEARVSTDTAAQSILQHREWARPPDER